MPDRHMRPVRTLVLVACVLILTTVAINAGVSVYNAVVLENPMLAGLAIFRAVLSSTALGVLLLALQRIRMVAEMEHDNAEFLRGFILRNVGQLKQPGNTKRAQQGAAPAEAETAP